MGYSEAYFFSDENYAGIYCEDCANEAWKQEAISRLEHAHADHISSTLDEIQRLEPNLVDESQCSDNGEWCETCTTQVCPAYYRCSGCENTGWANEGFETGLTEQIDYVDTETDQEHPTVPWCERCEEENRYAVDTVLLGEDCRGYHCVFMPKFMGVMTYQQPVRCQGDYYHTDDPIYRAGCRRFTLADAISHWGDPQRQRRPESREALGAIELLAMVVGHAIESGTAHAMPV
jgi:hypothetical protein